jgi:hypothetical protein
MMFMINNVVMVMFRSVVIIVFRIVMKFMINYAEIVCFVVY